VDAEREIEKSRHRLRASVAGAEDGGAGGSAEATAG